MNHKRHRPKNRRSGCLMCKYWKVNGADRRTYAEKKDAYYSSLAIKEYSS